MNVYDFVERVRNDYQMSGLEFVDACDMILLFLENQGILSEEDNSLFPKSTIIKIKKENKLLKRKLSQAEAIIKELVRH